MFVTVRYGEDKTKIFNADCKNEILLENIKLHCECGQNDVVEVSDEQGVVKNLRNYPTEYGSDFLKERETLVLLTVKYPTTDTTRETTKPIFTPLLASLCADRDFIDTLNQEREPEPTTVNSPANRRRQQLQSSDVVDNVSNKALKPKVRISNSSTFSTAAKKSLSRKSTKALFRK